MSDPCKDLRKSFTDILQLVMSMSASVIKKSEIILKDVETLDLSSADAVSAETKKLLDRINTNLSSFMTSYDDAVKSFKVEVEKNKNGLSPRTKLNLSLRRRGDTQDTDITISDSEEIAPASSQENSKSVEKGSSDVITVSEKEIKEAESEDNLSDADTEKTIQYFDVPVTKEIEGFSDCENVRDDLSKAFDDLEKRSDKLEIESLKLKHSLESMSFDFDNFEDDNLENLGIPKLEQSTDVRDRITKDNNELLDLLTKAVGDPEDNQPITDIDGEEAVQILEDEVSLSTTFDFDDDSDTRSSIPSDVDSADEFTLPPTTWRSEESGNESDISDNESADEKEPEVQLKPFSLKITKVDECDDAEIDRLCNLYNLNKRKCQSEIRKIKAKKRRRIRVLSSTSSSSESSEASSYESCTTPDLVIDTQRSPTPPPINELADVTALADELVDKLDKEDEDTEVDSGSSTDIDLEEDEENVTKKKKKEDEVGEESKDEAKEEGNPEKKRGSWRDEIRLWSDSDDGKSIEDVEEVVEKANDDDVEEIPDDDPLDDVKKEEDDKKEAWRPKITDVTTIITDSDSDDSDDVTFIEESTLSESTSGKGRRNIRAILSDDELNELTQRAKSEEDERILRLEEHSKTVESIQSQHEDFILDADSTSGKASITVDYNLAAMLKPHQKDGVQFMWEACYESVETLKTKSGTGCILAHCMGLGKTLQVITLIHTLFTHPVTNTKHVLVICPLSTVHNWRNEFRKTFRQLVQPPSFPLIFVSKGDASDKISQIRNWRRTGGVLVMGYESFQILTNEKMAARVTPQNKIVVNEALLDPGPDLIVCDEGHQIKNGKTLRSKALMRVKTKRRIVLTGTPLQNNLKEYYYMVHFVKPHILGTITEYNNRFGTPIANGQFHDSRPEDIKLMKKRTHVLNKLLKKTIHRVETSVLQSYLPDIFDYTMFIRLTPLQVQLYTKYVEMVTGRTRNFSAMFFHDFMVLSFNSLHPYTLHLYYTKPKPKKKRKRNEEEVTNVDDREHDTQDHVKEDWYKEFFPADVATNVNYSSKLKTIMDFIDETVRCGEKALIFGKWLVELDVLEHFLKTQGTANIRNWRPNVDYYRMDGDTPIENRDTLCRDFNTKSTAKIFMLTHKVGGLGLNLTGANRVIMIGSNHNPSLDTQSMYRVYRFGQEKKCYVYRLLSLGTMEEKIYHRCVIKLHLSGTVVDKLHFGRPFTATDYNEMYKIQFDDYENDRPIPVVPTDKLLALLIQNNNDIYKYYLHNSLLENRPEEELTDEDKRQAWDEFNNMEDAVKQAAVPVLPPLPNPAQTNPLNRTPTYAQIMALYHNRFEQDKSRNNNMVPNPMNNNSRGFIPRALQQNGTPLNVSQNNPFLRLLDQNRPVFRTSVIQNAKQVIQNFERLKAIPAAHRLQNLAKEYRDNRPREVPSANEAPSPSGGSDKGKRNTANSDLKFLMGVGNGWGVGNKDGVDEDLVRMLEDEIS